MALPNSRSYPWLADSLKQLAELYQQQRLAHALLFYGPEGIGKLELAQVLAALLLCKAPAATACGQCKSCLLLAAGNHADILLLQPENASLGVDEIRRLTEFTQSKAQQSGNKVVIVRHAERLTEAAANALLKTLEEPPQGCFLILCTAQAQRLKPTILSRCQRWDLAPLSPQQLIDYLHTQQQGPIPDFITSFSAGAPLKALSLLQSSELETLQQLIAQLQQLIRNSEPLAPVIKQLEGRNDLTLLLSYVLRQHLTTEPMPLPTQMQALQQSLFRFCRDEQQILGQNKTLALSALLTEWRALLKAGRPGRDQEARWKS
ncbi:MAG: DNA polymerase III subunit delta' [Alishewanella sp. 34-51-39]|nr:MAG: DNA polymerase III subunit delta' [Alishewanella sp. 34-51-39]